MAEIRKITFVASECQPYIASGGLGDVIGSLPKAIAKAKKNYEVSVIVPCYSKIDKKVKEKMEFVAQTTVALSWRKQYCGIYRIVEKNVTYYFIDNEYYFKRDRLYGYFDDAERFAFFSKAAIEVMLYLGEIPNIIHCHDWQTGLLPIYLRTIYYGNVLLMNVKTIFTIHNIEYQGRYNLSENLMEDVFGISINDGYLLEYKGGLNIMKGAMESSNKVSTVSPTYAEEICTSTYAHELEHEVLRVKEEGKLFGILNGIDTTFYNPSKDKAIYQKYSIKSLEDKKINKAKLQEELNLPVSENTPLIGMVSRLVSHKGLDILRDAFDTIAALDLQIVILGTGDEYYEHFLKEMEYRYPNKVKTIIDFNQVLSRKIYAGCDLFLMPSKSEPCGLSQMIASVYGTVAVVRETGGLKDSIIDVQQENGMGYTFKDLNGYQMYETIKRAISDYNSPKWEEIVKAAISKDFSWKQSAKEYIKEYEKLLK